MEYAIGWPVDERTLSGVTNLPADRATPTQLASLVREHWGIKSLHWLRDTLYQRTTPPSAPDQDPASWPR